MKYVGLCFLFLFCCSYSEGSIDFRLEKKEFYVKHGDQINLKGSFFVEDENTPLIIRVESPEGFVIDMSQSVYYSPYSEVIEINISVSSSLPPGKYKLKVLVENIDVFDTEEVIVNLSPGICKNWINVSDSLGFKEYLKRNNRLVKIVDDKILLQESGDQWSELMNVPLPSPNWVALDQQGLPIVVYSDVVAWYNETNWEFFPLNSSIQNWVLTEGNDFLFTNFQHEYNWEDTLYSLKNGDELVIKKGLNDYRNHSNFYAVKDSSVWQVTAQYNVSSSIFITNFKNEVVQTEVFEQPLPFDVAFSTDESKILKGDSNSLWFILIGRDNFQNKNPRSYLVYYDLKLNNKRIWRVDGGKNEDGYNYWKYESNVLVDNESVLIEEPMTVDVDIYVERIHYLNDQYFVDELLLEGNSWLRISDVGFEFFSSYDNYYRKDSYGIQVYSCFDCHGDSLGGALIDICGVCSGGETGIEVNDCVLSDNERSGYEMVLYPNPASSRITLSESGFFSVYNVLGEEVYHSEIERDGVINIEGWVSGVYYFELKNEEGYKQGSFVKE